MQTSDQHRTAHEADYLADPSLHPDRLRAIADAVRLDFEARIAAVRAELAADDTTARTRRTRSGNAARSVR